MTSDHAHSRIISGKFLLSGIQGLRGLAAVAVLLYHMVHLTNISPPNYFWFIARYFGYGVHLFFVLSAFSLMYSTENRVNQPAWVKEYFIKRFFRIAPLFYLLILFFAIKAGLSENTSIILLNFLFVFGFSSDVGLVWGGWTIGVEVIFYLIFPTLILIITTYRVALIILIISFFISYLSWSVLHEDYLTITPRPRWDWSYFSFIPNICFFMVGICAFKLKKLNDKLNLTILIIQIIIIIYLLVIRDIFEYKLRIDLMVLSIEFGVLCIWQSISPNYLFSNPFLDYLGERSYSIYLLHPIVIMFFKDFIVKWYEILSFSIGNYSFFICSFFILGVILPIAEITYRFIEVPGIHIGRKIIEKMRD